MATQEETEALAAAALRMRSNFEGKNAIYLEKGAIYVRVSNVRYDGEMIRADIEEIPAPGLPFWIVYRDPAESHPLRWTIATSSRPAASDDSWTGPAYVAWRLRFSQPLIDEVLHMAAHFPEGYNSMLRYRLISSHVEEDQAKRLHALVSRIKKRNAS